MTKNSAGLPPTPTVLRDLARMIDTAMRDRDEQGIKNALLIGHAIQDRPLTNAQEGVLRYCLGNAWLDLEAVRTSQPTPTWAWQRPEMEFALREFRLASRDQHLSELSRTRKARLFTNIGNCLSALGRFVEAIPHWRSALTAIPTFEMALGNFAVCLEAYAGVTQRSLHRDILLLEAQNLLSAAVRAGSSVDSDAMRRFSKLRSQLLDQSTGVDGDLQSLLGQEVCEVRESWSLEQWAVRHTLYLNPINDLGAYECAAHDCTFVPISDSERLTLGGLGDRFDAMRNEYILSRELLYQSCPGSPLQPTTSALFGFSGKAATPCSVNGDKVKIAYRTAYSILDKIAVFLNDYLGLGITPERTISFRSFWYDPKPRRFNTKVKPPTSEKSIRREFACRQNWPLRGLYWLSLDLDDRGIFGDALDPSATGLASLRNALEHSGLIVCDDDALSGIRQTPAASTRFVGRSELQAKALQLLRTVRAAIMYLAIGVATEEGPRVMLR